jgi:hypothetical protein
MSLQISVGGDNDMDHSPGHSAARAKDDAENATEAENTRQETPEQEQANG